ncbi:MAG: DUF11 domain-containing protein [Gammaproteobacteria bacterium]|nr:DUF11 domain-containing protein [Gammaproteobacteria bacterium]
MREICYTLFNRSCIVLSFCVALLTHTAFAAPLAGSLIDNQASVRYVDSVTGLASMTTSNTVRIVVQPFDAVLLTQNQSVQRAAGSHISLAHRLSNTGNTETTYALAVANLGGDDFDLIGPLLVRDLNSNGVADANEPAIGSVTLAPGESANLVIVGTLPSTLSAGTAARIQLSAVSQRQNIGARNDDVISASTGAVLVTTLSASTTTPARNDNVTLHLVTRNTGGAPATTVTFSVDGAADSGVLLLQSVPANTTFTHARCPANARLLYHSAEMPASVYSMSAPSDPAHVIDVACAFAAMAIGETNALDVQVKINDNASGTITTAGETIYSDGVAPGDSRAPSNDVQLLVPMQAPRIDYYRDNDFMQRAINLTLGAPLHVQVDAGACNTDPTAVETVTVTITSELTGDSESYVATETAPNSGMFRYAGIPTANAAMTPPVIGSGALETGKNDVLMAVIRGCGATETTTTIFIDPFGIVYDSRTNSPLAGITVQLIDVTGEGNGGNAGGPALVFEDDGLTPAPSTIVTSADGSYRFALVSPSIYRLQLSTLAGFDFPSQLAPSLQPAGRIIDVSGSYGGNFTISAASGAVRIDIPLDADAVGGLLTEKVASRNVAEFGDFIEYTVQVKNASGSALPGIQLADRLPIGFMYQLGSARQDGARVGDPAGGRGPVLTFSLGNLADDAITKIVYRLRVGPGTHLGDNVNSAQASSAAPLARISNVATAKVRIEGGVFDDRGFILGKIYADCNADRIQNEGERGIPGVRIWLEDGTYAISDGEGKFSFYGISPRTHVAKVDPITLPAGAKLVPLAQRNLNDGDSRFVDLKNGELARADFAVGNCDAGVMQEVERRRAKAQQGKGEVEAGVAKPLNLENAGTVDPHSLAASGVIVDTSPAHETPHESPYPSRGGPGWGWGSCDISADATHPPPALPLEGGGTHCVERKLADVIGDLDNTPDFIALTDGAVLSVRQIKLRVKGVLDAPLTLRVNGEAIADSRIGTRVVHQDRKLEAREYIGIDLQPGKNTLTLEQRDPFGNLRATKTITLLAPGDLARLRLDVVQADADINSPSIAKVSVRLEDTNGLAVAVRTPLTLEASVGTWLVEDLNKIEPGVQIFVEGGRTQFDLRAPEQLGDVQIRVSSGALSAETKFTFTPSLRDMVAAGLIEGTLNVRHFKLGALQPARRQDGFEQELKNYSWGDDHHSAAARAALFLKGKIKGDYLLTLGFDSDKSTRERLFRDIQPDQFYPVYGDASVKGFDAQSSQRLYVRVDKNKSWLLYGDFTTSETDPARNLAAYNRSLTGVREHYESNGVTVNAFASEDSVRQVVEEIPANGTSGPYALANTNLIVNSEKVEIITRDRNQPALVINSVPQTRFTDYELESFSGSLLFRAPVASVDANLNPNFIRVTYEVDQGGDAFWIGGVDAKIKVTDNVGVGAVAIQDRNPQDPSTVRGVNATVKNGDTTFIAEVAQSDKLSVGTGNAERIDVKHEDGDLQARAYAGRSDANFDNSSSTLTKGRSEAGAKASYKIDERTRLVGEAIHTGDVTTGGERDGQSVGVERSFDNSIKVEAGVRHARETLTPAQPTSGVTPNETTSVRAKIGAPVPGVANASVYGEAEQAIDNSDRKLVAVGGEYRFSDKGRLYGRHELISSIASPYGLDANQRNNTTVVGIDNEYMKDGRAFSEYRAADSFSGRESEAAMGLHNGWQVAEGVRLNTGLERIQTLSGESDQESTAVTGAVEYTRNPLWKGGARLEYRMSPSANSLLNTLGLAVKLDEQWTFLGRNIISLTDNKTLNAGDRVQERLQLGFAYRDVATNVWNGLGRYEYKRESDSTSGSQYLREAHIVSTHINVQPSQPLVISGHYAIKFVDEYSGGIDSRGTTQLIAARVTRDVGQRWDVGAQVSSLFSGGFASHQYGVGTELGYRMQDNLWIAVGYNVLGFKDADLAGDEYTERGVYLRLRFKFDEKLFERMK